MKRVWFILLGGVLIAAAGYCVSFMATGGVCCSRSPGLAPELTWLQSEFHLTDAEMSRISALHSQYTSECADRCKRIDVANQDLQRLLRATNSVTPEIETALRNSARIRAECQSAMLQHFYDVSRTMPPEQGRRYFDWITARTLGPEHDNMMRSAEPAGHDHHAM